MYLCHEPLVAQVAQNSSCSNTFHSQRDCYCLFSIGTMFEGQNRREQIFCLNSGYKGMSYLPLLGNPHVSVESPLLCVWFIRILIDYNMNVVLSL